MHLPKVALIPCDQYKVMLQCSGGNQCVGCPQAALSTQTPGTLSDRPINGNLVERSEHAPHDFFFGCAASEEFTARYD
jgi:hypothetical protein